MCAKDKLFLGRAIIKIAADHGMSVKPCGEGDFLAHYCKYCYANNDLAQFAENQKLHDPASPFLIGGSLPGDKLHIAEQKSWVDNQLELGFE